MPGVANHDGRCEGPRSPPKAIITTCDGKKEGKPQPKKKSAKRSIQDRKKKDSTTELKKSRHALRKRVGHHTTEPDSQAPTRTHIARPAKADTHATNASRPHQDMQKKRKKKPGLG